MPDRPSAPTPASPPSSPAPPATTTRELLGESKTLRIEHNGEFYVLRLTRNDRLILTK